MSCTICIKLEQAAAAAVRSDPPDILLGLNEAGIRNRARQKESGHSRQRQTLKSTSDHAPRGQTVRRFDWCCVAASEVLGVSVQFTPRIAVGEHPKLRPRILRATESPEMPTPRRNRRSG